MKTSVLILLLASCSLSSWSVSAQQQIATNVPPELAQPRALAPDQTELPSEPDETSPDEPVDIQFLDAPLPAVIEFLARQLGITAVIDPKLRDGRVGADGQVAAWPEISLTFANQTTEEVLDKLLRDHGLVLIHDTASDVALVTDLPPGMETNALAAEPAMPEALVPEDEVLPVIPLDTMPLQQAIETLAVGAELNILFDPRLLTGTNAISTNMIPVIKFYNKTHQQALQALLKNYELVLVPDPETDIARVTPKPPPNQEPLVTEVVQLKYSSPTNIVKLLETLHSVTNRTSVTSDQRTSQLIIRATENDMEAITNLVAQLDTPTKQVLIEARLLETSKNPRSIRGIDWSGTLEGQNVQVGNGRTVGSTTTLLPGEPTTVTLPSGRTVTTRPSRSSQTVLETSLGNGGLSMDTARGFYPDTAFLNADGVRAVLSFLNTEADARVLATPRAVTLDNEPARLSVTRAFPIFEITPGTENSPPIAQITYTNLGTILNVTPQIAANSNVSLHIVPEVSNIDSVDSQIVNGQQNTANVYAIRTMETRVMVPSGHTLVMGGLISDTTSKAYTKVPFLGDIPGLGLLFRRDTRERSKANLIIFLTPTIIQDGDFRKTDTDFLQQPLPEADVPMDTSPLERGKPYGWGKKSED